MGRDKGIVAFPGGMKDDADADEVETSLREACEEIGLQRSQVEVIAVLPPHTTYGDILVTPVVGFVCPDFQPKPNEEVDAVFSVPLKRFLSDPGHYSKLMKDNELTFHVHFFRDVVRDNTFITYGLTAHICMEVAMVYLQRPPSFDYYVTIRATLANPFVLAERYLLDHFGKL